MTQSPNALREHSIIETVIGDLGRITDPNERIAIIKKLDRELDALHGRSVLERVALENAERESRLAPIEEAFPASHVAMMGIIRGRYADAGEAADKLLGTE